MRSPQVQQRMRILLDRGGGAVGAVVIGSLLLAAEVELASIIVEGGLPLAAAGDELASVDGARNAEAPLVISSLRPRLAAGVESIRSGALLVVGCRKYRKISPTPIEGMKANLLVAGNLKLAAQEIGRHAVPRNRSVEIDNTDHGSWFQCRRQIVQKRVGLGDLVIDLDEDGSIEPTNG